MNFKKPGPEYWRDKFYVYLHDPFDKAFCIEGHKKRAEQIIEAFGEQPPTGKNWYSLADSIASSFERGTVPSHNKNANMNGAVNFIHSPLLTHPLSQEKPLEIELPLVNYGDNKQEFAKTVNDEICEFIREVAGGASGSGYLSKFEGDEEEFVKARFFFTHFALRFLFAEKNIGGLGALWHKIPADTRFPDHSIWNHNALTSAIYSTLELGKNIKNIGLFVFSITPVQSFIRNARRLRDFWSGSVILSWLAFEGLKWVMENLGPDHVIYPSLVDQPLVNQYLLNDWKIGEVDWWKKQNKEIASLPNKFLFIAPVNFAEELAEKIEKAIANAWHNLEELSFRFISEKIILNDEEKNILKNQFDRQFSNYWNYDWAIARFLGKDDREEIAKLFHREVYEKQFEILEIFEELANEVYPNRSFRSGEGSLYSITHELVQSVLASSKGIKECNRQPENGEKCTICGEYEVLHMCGSTNISAKDYKKSVDEFWKRLRKVFKNDLRENERLCSVCLTKRLAYKILGKEDGHILYGAFKGQDSYPSTSYIALYDYFKRKEIRKERQKQEYAQALFENEDRISCNNEDKYYAILFMDGDKMGDLISGKNMASGWKSVMHPDIVERLEQETFYPLFHEKWGEIFERFPKRLVTPAIHSTISESLADFSVYGVYNIIRKHNGKLIYAGGDDVCAILPISTAIKAAREIQKYYNSSYKIIKEDLNGNSIEDIEMLRCEKTRGEKLSFGLGNGEYRGKKNISISAGILFCHHKENLKEMLNYAHSLLEKRAKEKAGRNACAIALKKRTGSIRYFVRKWDDETWNDFEEVIKAFSRFGEESLTRSFIYKIEKLKDGIKAILKQSNHELLVHFLISQLKRSGLKEEVLISLAERVARILITPDNELTIDGLVISSFLAKRGKTND